MTAPRSSAAPVVRRLVVYTILFVLVLLTATGLADLLGRLFENLTDDLLAGGGSAGLAGALTFSLIGGPLAVLLAWFAWRRLADPAERASLAWALYLVGMTTVALIVAGTAVLGGLAAAVTGEVWSAQAATGLVWAVVWAVHGSVLRRSDRRPTRLPFTAAVLGGSYGLVIAVGGAVTALTVLFSTAITELTAVSVGGGWWSSALRSLVWAAGGAALWWWHWRCDGGRRARTALAEVALVGLGILGGCLLTLTGCGTVLYVLLRLAAAHTDALPDLLDPLGHAVAAALVGGLVWAFHRDVVARRSAGVRQAGTLVTSGIGLSVAATGIGVIVNALLAALSTPLAGDSPRALLLGGVSALLVGGPLWWAAWRPARVAPAPERRSTGRSVYLVAVFGISAIVALISLLVIGFRLFDSLLAGDAGLVERVRAPLGLLVATALVAGYHFAIWRGDRAAVATGTPVGPPSVTSATPATPPVIGELVLIMGPGAEPVVRHLREVTGAPVTLWQRTGAASMPPDPAVLVRALDGVRGERVVVIVADDGAVSVIEVAGIPLEPTAGRA